MNRYARIESVEVLRDLRSALCIFAQKAAGALEEAQADIHRTVMWLKQNQFRHWKAQVRLRTEQCAQAKLAFESKQRYQEIAAIGKTSNIDEKKAYAHAKHQMEEARQKLAKVKRWVPIMEKEIFTYRGLVQGLTNAIEIEIPKACAQIDRMIDSLETYLASRSSGDDLASLEGVPPDEVGYTRDIWTKDDRFAAPEEATVADYRTLRKRSPTQQTREMVKISEAPDPWRLGELVRETSRKILVEMKVEYIPIAMPAKVIIAQTTRDHQRIYLERVAPKRHTDSGWYLGTVGKKDTEHIAIRCAQLLDKRPDLRDILSLPAGYLVVINEDFIEAILDPDDNIVAPQTKIR